MARGESSFNSLWTCLMFSETALLSVLARRVWETQRTSTLCF